MLAENEGPDGRDSDGCRVLLLRQSACIENRVALQPGKPSMC